MYTVQQYAHTLYEVLEDTHSKDHQKVIDNFVNILVENNDSGLYQEIIKEVKKIEQEKKDKKTVEIITARPLKAQEEQTLFESINDCLGKNVEFKKAVDQGLISGLVIKVDDVVIDGSVKKRLEKMKSKIIDN